MRTITVAFILALLSATVVLAQGGKYIGGWGGKVSIDIAGGQVGGTAEESEGEGEYEGESEGGDGWMGEGTLKLDVSQAGDVITIGYNIVNDGSGPGIGSFVLDRQTLSTTATKLSGSTNLLFKRRPSCNEENSSSLSMPSSDCWERVYDTRLQQSTQALPAGYTRVAARVDVTITGKGKAKGSITIDKTEYQTGGSADATNTVLSFDGLAKRKI
jgi:hypothetical protein